MNDKGYMAEWAQALTATGALLGLGVAAWMITVGQITTSGSLFSDSITYQLRPLGILLAALICLFTPVLLLVTAVAKEWLTTQTSRATPVKE